MPDSRYHPAAMTLQVLFLTANETERELARDLGVSLVDYRALSTLTASGPATVGQLAEDLGATPATTSAMVDRLESRGYVTRARSAEDRRNVHVSATPAACVEIRALMRPLLKDADSYLKALPAADQEVVTDFLTASHHLMSAHLRVLSSKDTP